MSSFPVLTTKRLQLRQLSDNDVGDIFELFRDDHVTRYYDIASFSERNEAEEWINAMTRRFSTNQGIRWAITRNGHEKVIGTCGFVWKSHNYSAVLGYELTPDYWGNGYITEAVEAIVGAAFHSMAPFQLNRVEALTYPENGASMAVLKKLGFEREGVLRQWGYWKGEFHDLACFSVLRQGWCRV